jgi:outer membrane protein assembly factor BamB
VAALAGLVIARDPDVLRAFTPAEYTWDVREPRQFILPSVFLGPLAPVSPATSEYRGNAERTGRSLTKITPRLAREWCYSPLNVGLHGASKASPAVDASGVYVGTDSGFVHAIDHDGHARWSVYLADSGRGVHATAALDEQSVYVGAYNGVFYALDKRDGSIRWAKTLGDSIGASAALHEGYLYVSVETNHPDGFLVKLDARDGHLVWVSAWLEEQSHSSPTLSPRHDRVMVGSNSGRMWAFAMSTGRTAWSRTLTDAMKGTALVTGNRVIFSSWEKRTLALDVVTGEQIWSAPATATSQVSPTLLEKADLVLTADGAGVVRALDPASGRLRWERRTHVRHHQASGLVTLDERGREIVWSLGRTRTLAALEPRSGRVLGETALDANFSGQPVAYDGAMYLALDGPRGGLCKYKRAR